MERKYPKLKELQGLKTYVSKKENPKKFDKVMKKFEEPFNEISNNDKEFENYSIKNILKPIFSDNKQASPGDFPNNIEEIYYNFYEDEFYEQYWKMLCKLSNGNYAYFEVYVCSCGFTNWGQNMNLYVSRSFKKLFDEAMDKYTYEDFMEKIIK